MARVDSALIGHGSDALMVVRAVTDFERTGRRSQGKIIPPKAPQHLTLRLDMTGENSGDRHLSRVRCSADILLAVELESENDAVSI